MSVQSQEMRLELQAFMRSIGQLESGGRYHILGPQTKYGRPRGKYQILDSNWSAWAKEAGIPGADWRDPSAQERVAAYKFLQYYNNYGGRWDAVAVAWFAGPGRARKYLENASSVTHFQDVLGTSVGGYVERVMDGMGKNLGRNPYELGYLDFSVGDPAVPQNSGQVQTIEQAADRAMQAFSSIFKGEPRTMGALNVEQAQGFETAAISDVDRATLKPTEEPAPSPGASEGTDLSMEQKRLLKGG